MSSPIVAEEASNWTLAVRSRASSDWDTFLKSRPRSSLYLRSGWSELARDLFGHAAVFIEARDSHGKLAGVLPIVQQRSLLLGNFATSVPFFNSGGAECDSEALAQMLMMKACAIAQQWGCSYLEFRDTKPRGGDWIVRKDKVSMVLPLPRTFAELSKQLGSKLRSQVKRADREDAGVQIGGAELVSSFYDIFAENMRDLGTPVYPRRFFEEIVSRFSDLCHLLIVTSNAQPVAGAFLIVANGRAEIPWASCRAKAKPLGFNMRLYWEVLRYVTELQCSEFDFGRSTVDAGTYKFKKQWGAQPVQLYWHRWEKNPRREHDSAEQGTGGLMQRASQLWRRLPMPVANTIGPWLSPKLPW